MSGGRQAASAGEAAAAPPQAPADFDDSEAEDFGAGERSASDDEPFSRGPEDLLDDGCDDLGGAPCDADPAQAMRDAGGANPQDGEQFYLSNLEWADASYAVDAKPAELFLPGADTADALSYSLTRGSALVLGQAYGRFISTVETAFCAAGGIRCDKRPKYCGRAHGHGTKTAYLPSRSGVTYPCWKDPVPLWWAQVSSVLAVYVKLRLSERGPQQRALFGDDGRHLAAAVPDNLPSRCLWVSPGSRPACGRRGFSI